MAQWKVIKGYEEEYAVSDKGEVVSFHKLKQAEKHGYLCATLSKNGGQLKVKYVHRLVAEAFLENADNLPQVNHKDKNRKNNNVENLEWCTAEYNNRHAHGRKVEQYDLFGNKLAEYSSLIVAQNITGVSQSCISHACNGDCKTAGGFVWKYVKEDN